MEAKAGHEKESETEAERQEPLREVDRKKWKHWEDREYQREEIAAEMEEVDGWIVELVGGSDRGGVILLWEKVKLGSKDEVGDLAWELENEESLGYFSDKYSHIEEDGIHYRLFDEVHFMRYTNAKSEYDEIETVEEITNLAWRNR